MLPLIAHSYKHESSVAYKRAIAHTSLHASAYLYHLDILSQLFIATNTSYTIAGTSNSSLPMPSFDLNFLSIRVSDRQMIGWPELAPIVKLNVTSPVQHTAPP